MISNVQIKTLIQRVLNNSETFTELIKLRDELEKIIVEEHKRGIPESIIKFHEKIKEEDGTYYHPVIEYQDDLSTYSFIRNHFFQYHQCTYWEIEFLKDCLMDKLDIIVPEEALFCMISDDWKIVRKDNRKLIIKFNKFVKLANLVLRRVQKLGDFLSKNSSKFNYTELENLLKTYDKY